MTLGAGLAYRYGKKPDFERSQQFPVEVRQHSVRSAAHPTPLASSAHLGTRLATSLAHAGSRSGVLSPAVLFAHARGIRQNPTRHCGTSSGQVAGETQTHRTRTILSARKRTRSIIRRRCHSSPADDPPISPVQREPISWMVPATPQPWRKTMVPAPPDG